MGWIEEIGGPQFNQAFRLRSSVYIQTIYPIPYWGESSGLMAVLELATAIFVFLPPLNQIKITKNLDCFDRLRTKSFASSRS
jgi:hypothetical protein